MLRLSIYSNGSLPYPFLIDLPLSELEFIFENSGKFINEKGSL